MAIRFLNTSFDPNKKVTFSYIRVIFLLIVFFSLGLASGIAWYSMKLNEIRFIELQVPVEPAPAITPTPTPAPTPAPIIDSVAGWQTYRNEEYGFEFNYPNNWQVENVVKGSFDSIDDADSLLMLAVYGNNKFIDSVWLEIRKANNINEAINDYIDFYCPQGEEVSREEKIMFDKSEGRFVYFNDFCASSISNPWAFVAHGANVFVMEAPLGLSLDDKNHSMILSAFKFLN